MKELSEILKYMLPSLVVGTLAYLVIREFLDKQMKVLDNELKVKQQSSTTPVILQAYERLVLFLERITPNNLLLRVSRPEYTSMQLHQQLLLAIRSEFEHNLSQQLFISKQAWEMIRRAKEDTIRIINTSASKVNTEASGTELAAEILQMASKEKRSSIEEALDLLKQEVRKFF